MTYNPAYASAPVTAGNSTGPDAKADYDKVVAIAMPAGRSETAYSG